MKRFALSALLILLTAALGSHGMESVARTMAGLPSLAFAPPGTAQQIAVLWEAMRRRARPVTTAPDAAQHL